MFLINFFLNLGSSFRFPQLQVCLLTPLNKQKKNNNKTDKTEISAKFSLRRSIFAQINGCHIFEVETQNRIIREPHFLLNLSIKKKSEKTMFSVHFRKFDIFVGYEVKLNKKI